MTAVRPDSTVGYFICNEGHFPILDTEIPRNSNELTQIQSWASPLHESSM